eukprot:272975-Pelagomonas_calceolata.AAC.4
MTGILFLDINLAKPFQQNSGLYQLEPVIFFSGIASARVRFIKPLVTLTHLQRSYDACKSCCQPNVLEQQFLSRKCWRNRVAMLQGGGLLALAEASCPSFTVPAAMGPPGGSRHSEAGVDALHSSHQVADAARPGLTLSSKAAHKHGVVQMSAHKAGAH